MGRRVRRWWHAAISSAAILSPQAVVAQPVHDVQIVAARFAFEPATIEVRAGERVWLVIRSKDVVHGFSIPDLKIDVQIPAGGEPITVEFAAPPPGRYDIACSEFCGTGHGETQPALVSVPSTGTAAATAGAADGTAAHPPYALPRMRTCASVRPSPTSRSSACQPLFVSRDSKARSA
jgi:heme/copper-type cytochrome/quinol oxidase subunit 2